MQYFTFTARYVIQLVRCRYCTVLISKKNSSVYNLVKNIWQKVKINPAKLNMTRKVSCLFLCNFGAPFAKN